MASAFTGDDILGELDAAARDHRFPALDYGNYFSIDARLHGFRDKWRWAIVVETVGYNPDARNLFTVLHVFGNCIAGPAELTEVDVLARIDDFDAVVGTTGNVLGNGVTALTINGSSVAVPNLPGRHLVDVFRGLVPIHRELLLADEDELRARVPADLPEVLRLDEWHHPDVSHGELPSGSETFRLLASLLVTGDLSRWRPIEPPNTHWKNWPAGGLG